MKSTIFSALASLALVTGCMSCGHKQRQIETNERGVPVVIADIIMGDNYSIDTLYKSDLSSVISITNLDYSQRLIYTADQLLANSPTLVIDTIQPGAVYEIHDLLRDVRVNFANTVSVDNFRQIFPQYPEFSTVVVGDTNAIGQKAVFAYAVNVPDKKIAGRDSLLRWVEHCLNDTMPFQAEARDFGATMEKRFFEDLKKRESEFTFTDSRSMLVWYLTPGYVTYYDYFWGFLGGAHGMYCQRLVSYSLQDNCAVTPEYLLKADASDDVRELIYEALADDEDFTSSHHLTSLSQVKSYVQDYLGDDQTLPIPDPGLMPQGVVFCYQPYEIGCYADGSFQLLVPYDKIMPYLAVNPLAETE